MIMANPTTSHPEFVRHFSQNARRLYSYLYLLVGNEVDADDVFQETSRVLWEKFDEFTPGTSFLAWAERVAHFQTLHFRKRKQRDRLQFSAEFIDAVAQQRAGSLEALERRRQALDDCLGKLREPDQQLIKLRYSEGATTKSVAERVGRSVDAVYKALNRIEGLLLDCTQRVLHGRSKPAAEQG
jgi:RNA polymerase sigma-70 factor (ECF subfamily)